MLRILAPALLLALALAGCSNGPGGQSAAGDGSLVFNGTGTGTHDARTTCGSSADIHVSANLGSGAVSFQVSDGQDKQVYTKRATSGQTADSVDRSGASGSWTIRATREPGFTGQYSVHVQC